MQKQIFIGSSGYYYPQWKNNFYPAGLASSKWLSYYSTVFNSVELNGTFYHTPKLSDLKKYAEQTPDNFGFSVKVHKAITHQAKLKDAALHIRSFAELLHEGLGGKLKKMLYQLPPSFQYSEENMFLILENIPAGTQHVVELRHISWWNNNIEQKLAEKGYTICNADYPGLQHKTGCTNRHFYARLHGAPDLFKSSYSHNQLKAFCDNLPLNCDSYCVYFNNTYYSAAYENARELMQLVQERNELIQSA